jgi:hypothetical protein
MCSQPIRRRCRYGVLERRIRRVAATTRPDALLAEAASAKEAEYHKHQNDDQDDQQNGERWPPSGDGIVDVPLVLPTCDGFPLPARSGWLDVLGELLDDPR